MARLFNPEFVLGQQQQRLQERRLQLENDPGRIFLRSLSQTVPQQLVKGGVEMGLGAADYYLLGGQRKQMADEALQFPDARDPFFKKYHRDVYDKAMEARQRAKTPPSQQARSAQRPLKLEQEKKPRKEQPTRKGSDALRTRSFGDGRIGVRVDMDLSQHEGTPDELDDKLRRQGIVLIDGIPYRVLNQEQSARYVASERKSQLTRPTIAPAPNIPPPVYIAPGSFASTAEVQQATELRQKDYQEALSRSQAIAEKEFGEQMKTGRKKLDKLQDMLKTTVTKSFEYIGISGVDDLRKSQDNMLNSMAASNDIDEIDLYLNALAALPTESQILNAKEKVDSPGGSKVGQADTRKRGGTNIKMPSTYSFQSAAEKAQIVVNRLRKSLAAESPGTKRYNKIAKALKKAEAEKNAIVVKSQGNKSSTGPVVVDENGDVLVGRSTAENYGGVGVAPSSDTVSDILVAGSTDAKRILNPLAMYKGEGRLTKDAADAYDTYMDEGQKSENKKPSRGAADNLASFLDLDGQIKKEFLLDPKETFNDKYPNLAPHEEDLKTSTLMKKPGLLKELNSQIEGENVPKEKMQDIVQAIANRDSLRVRDDTNAKVVKDALVDVGIIKIGN